MKIIGISFEQFLENTKSAFSAANISNIQRDSLVRKFLNFQLFPNQNTGENEHRLQELFSEEVDTSPATHVIVITFERYEHNSVGDLRLWDSTPFVCGTSEAAEKKLRDLFIDYYPEHAHGEHLLENSRMVEDFVDRSEDNDEGELTEKVMGMDFDEARDWLLENFSLDDLTDEGFFSDFLSQELYKIRVETAEIIQ